MCLDSLLPIPKEYEDKEKEFVGFVLRETCTADGYYISPVFRHIQSVGCWAKADTKSVISFHTRTYNSGFHIFLHKEDAMLYLEHGTYLGLDTKPCFYKICEVRFKDVTSYGLQTNIECVVANWIKIEKEVV